VERSAALLTAAGDRIVPLAEPIGRRPVPARAVEIRIALHVIRVQVDDPLKRLEQKQ
jgi:hypothetical protein